MCKPRYRTLGESVKFMRGMGFVITCNSQADIELSMCTWFDI